MGFFFRRSVRFGPFRLNFSKSGIGASVGVKGARLTTTPRGTTYVTVGTHGFYYRESVSGRNRTQPRLGTAPPTSEPVQPGSPDVIATADVSDLVDSSSATLVQRLNERANMVNPAWLLYILAVAILVVAAVVFLPYSDFALPDVSPRVQRRAVSVDEYSSLVMKYGYPQAVLAAEPLGMVDVRVAQYRSVTVGIVFVPDGCVEAFDRVIQALTLNTGTQSKKRPALKPVSPCIASPNGGWTIVGYNDFPEIRQGISGDEAGSRLAQLTSEQSSPPVIQTETAVVPMGRPRAARGKKATPSDEVTTKPDKQVWAVRDQDDRIAKSQAARQRLVGCALLLTAVGLFVLGIVVHNRNTEKRTSRLFYELNELAQKRYDTLQEGFLQLSKSHRIWRLNASSPTSDWKRNAGASQLVRRVGITVEYSNPPRVETNLSVPCINLGTVRLFFLPDAVLYLDQGTYGGVAYNDLRVEQSTTRFIEDETVPGDATMAGRTWRYVSKSGGPDGRFKDNAQLPVLQYGVLVMTSSRGLNIHLYTSNAQSSAAFADSWRALVDSPGQLEKSRPSTPLHSDISSDPIDNAYKMLGLGPNATPGEISAAYRHLAQMYHPDKVVGLAPEFQFLADRRMKEINAALETIRGQQKSVPPNQQAA